MKIYIRKTKSTLIVHKETTTKSILSDLASILVIVVLFGMNILFSKLIGESWMLDVLCVFVLLVYFYSTVSGKEQVKTIEEVKQELDNL